MSEAHEQPVPSEPLAERIPESLTTLLSELWSRQIGQENSAQYGDNLPYRYMAPQVGLVLEHLVKSGKMANNEILFASDGRLKEIIPAAQLKPALLEAKPLQGLTVFVLGGTEGRIFAEMGATALNLHPDPVRFPPSGLPNLQEIAENLSANFASQHQQEFDLTFSSRVFDSGSGLAWNLSEYKTYFSLLLGMTKVGGLGVHNGDQMGNIVKAADCKVLEIAPVHESDLRTNFFPTVYVIQK